MLLWLFNHTHFQNDSSVKCLLCYFEEFADVFKRMKETLSTVLCVYTNKTKSCFISFPKERERN